MIRPATAADVPRLVEMGRRFLTESEYRQHVTVNPAQLEETAAKLTASGGVLVSERAGALVGMIGYFLYPHFLSGELTAVEVFWWVEPEYRGEGVKLLREAEQRAARAGARSLQMIAPNDRVASLYQRLGYQFVEATYQRSL